MGLIMTAYVRKIVPKLMLSYSEIVPKKYIVIAGEPYEILESQVTKKQRQKPVNQTKLRNLITNNVTERAFHQSDKVEEADIETMSVRYLYNRKGTWWFDNPNNQKERHSVPEQIVGEKAAYLKPQEVVEMLIFGNRIIGIKLPIKVDLRVIETPPGAKGNTAQGGSKQAKLETGISISVPLFINTGDIVRVNTETGAYTERSQKTGAF